MMPNSLRIYVDIKLIFQPWRIIDFPIYCLNRKRMMYREIPWVSQSYYDSHIKTLLLGAILWRGSCAVILSIRVRLLGVRKSIPVRMWLVIIKIFDMEILALIGSGILSLIGFVILAFIGYFVIFSWFDKDLPTIYKWVINIMVFILYIFVAFRSYW